jgi:hypothetical protein
LSLARNVWNPVFLRWWRLKSIIGKLWKKLQENDNHLILNQFPRIVSENQHERGNYKTITNLSHETSIFVFNYSFFPNWKISRKSIFFVIFYSPNNHFNHNQMENGLSSMAKSNKQNKFKSDISFFLMENKENYR